MKDVALQLITVELENGKQGVFIGGPLITDDYSERDSQVDSVCFSDIQEVPADMTLQELINLVTRKKLGGSNTRLQ